MLSKIKYPETLEYSSDGNHLPIEFFMLTVPECKRIDLKLGYFSSNAIRTLAYGFAQFLYNGGHLRIITNHFLSYEDKMLLADEESSNAVAEDEIKSIIENDLEGLAELLKNGDQHFFNCLRFLLKNNRLQLIPVKLKPDKLAHYKQGIMDDGTDQVYFSGSCNFTYKGLIENGESLGIARSWGEFSEKLKIQENALSIDRICKKEDSSFEYLSADQITEVIVTKGQDKNLDELIEDELNVCDQLAKLSRLAKPFNNYTKTFRLKIESEKLKKREESQKPKFPYSEGPRDYQKEAYNNWVANDYKGIFAMATGTGKTITALNSILNETSKNYRALILVPTKVLTKQWQKEALQFNFQETIIVSSENPNWENDLRTIVSRSLFGIDSSFIIIATYASFVKRKFQNILAKLPTDTILIADEAHNIASPIVLKLLPSILFQRRIGLSATPKRIYDPEGSIIMEDFFDDNEPYTYSYSMEKAIEKEVLCPYFYYPKIVLLNEDELNSYIEITKKLAKFINSSAETEASKIYQNYLMKRKQILHKAVGKIGAFTELINQISESENGLKHTLVYAPEGFFTELQIDELGDQELNEENRIIDFYSSIVRRINPNAKIAQYTSIDKDREFIIESFQRDEIDVLVSMKCLDEGVDIPRTEKAIFCSSTGNPRQFIQRRGRVLRKHKEKPFAYIYDLVVIPMVNSYPNDIFEIERSLVRKELERVVHFATMAINKYEASSIFENICEHYNLNLHSIHYELSTR